MDPALAAATTGAADIQAPASPLGASNAPELANLYRSTFQLPQSNQAAGAQANVAQITVDNQKAAASAAAQTAKDLSNINSYKIVQKQDGGYDFIGPDGKQYDIATVSQNTGTKPSDLVKNSQNPVDIQYQQDYSNLQNFMQAVVSKDTKTINQFISTEPALKQYTTGKGGLQKLIDQFHQTYQRYYVPRSQDPNAWGATPGNTVVQDPQTGNSTAALIAQLQGK